jgi:hypothetical protein
LTTTRWCDSSGERTKTSGSRSAGRQKLRKSGIGLNFSRFGPVSASEMFPRDVQKNSKGAGENPSALADLSNYKL